MYLHSYSFGYEGINLRQIKVKVKEIKQLTPKIKEFEFVSLDGQDLPSFSAGAHIDFLLNGDLVRSYSLANDPSETHRYVTAVLRESDGGGGSVFMHDKVDLGSELIVTEPINNFSLSANAERHVLLAGGIGITPLLAMGYQLKSESQLYYLHYCTRTTEETPFKEEIKEIFGDKFDLYHDGGDPNKGINLKETFSEISSGTHLYICGPAGLLNAAREATSSWPKGSVHFELFKSAKTEPEIGEGFEDSDQSAGQQAFEVELAKSGKTLTIPPDKSILEVLWENDIDVMHACEEGWCGNCMVEYLSGGVDHRDEVLDDVERETKLQVCVSRALPGEKIILDL